MNAENIDDKLLREIETNAIQFAQQAGQILCEQFRKPMEVKFKDKNKTDPVTSADHLSDEYLKRAITEKFPLHSIMSEEGTALPKSDSDFVWVLDPLDGTANYINGLPLFAVSIAVLWKRQPVVGCIFVPVSHRSGPGVYHARLGQGAFLNDERIGVSASPPSRPLSEIPIQFGDRFRFSGQSRKEPHEIRNLGSIALEITMAASGIFQYALFGSPKLWDVAAGVLLVKESGGLSFFHRPKGKNWQILERFQLEQDNPLEALENLRKWSFPLVVGTSTSAGQIVKDIRIRRKPVGSLPARFLRRGNHPIPPSRK